jgi:signal peptidase I
VSGWDSWDPPISEDEEPPAKQQVEPDPGEYGWGDYPEWPVFSQSEYPAYGEYPPFGPDDFRAGEEQRPRDPLGRLFPGLPRGVRVTLDWVLTIVGAVLIVLALKHWVINPYRIPSSSMEPTLHCAGASGCRGSSSDRVLACRICLDFSDPSRGDIIVFNTPKAAARICGEGGVFVKRLIGLPGDTIKEDKQSFIWIRGPNETKFVKLKEPYISQKARAADVTHRNQTWNVPAGNYFMMGDNRGLSCDSRQWGSVPRNDLIGTVFWVYWPPDRFGPK